MIRDRVRRHWWMMAALTAIAVGAAITYVVNERSNELTVEVDAYEMAADPRQIILYFTGGLGDMVIQAVAFETSDTVAVTVKLRRTVTVTKVAIGVPMQAAVTLHEPLGARKVVDSAGQPIPRR